jgi:hypothetical protein
VIERNGQQSALAHYLSSLSSGDDSPLCCSFQVLINNVRNFQSCLLVDAIRKILGQVKISKIACLYQVAFKTPSQIPFRVLCEIVQLTNSAASQMTFRLLRFQNWSFTIKYEFLKAYLVLVIFFLILDGVFVLKNKTHVQCQIGTQGVINGTIFVPG